MAGGWAGEKFCCYAARNILTAAIGVQTDEALAWPLDRQETTMATGLAVANFIAVRTFVFFDYVCVFY